MSRAEMTRNSVSLLRNVKITVNCLPVFDFPRARYLCSLPECDTSGVMMVGSFRKTCSASTGVTPCFAFFCSLPLSHSKPVILSNGPITAPCIWLKYTPKFNHWQAGSSCIVCDDTFLGLIRFDGGYCSSQLWVGLIGCTSPCRVAACLPAPAVSSRPDARFPVCIQPSSAQEEPTAPEYSALPLCPDRVDGCGSAPSSCQVPPTRPQAG